MYEPHDPELYPLEGKLVALARTHLELGEDFPVDWQSAYFQRNLAKRLEYYGLKVTVAEPQSGTPDFLVRYDAAWDYSSFSPQLVARAQILDGTQAIKEVSIRASTNWSFPVKPAAESLFSLIHQALLEHVRQSQAGAGMAQETTPASSDQPSLADKQMTGINWRPFFLLLLVLGGLVWSLRDSWRPYLEALWP